jgi:hypothetical protein
MFVAFVPVRTHPLRFVLFMNGDGIGHVVRQILYVS